MRLLEYNGGLKDLTIPEQLLGYVPDAGMEQFIRCVAVIKVGDGVNDLDGSGGNFQMIIESGNWDHQPNPHKTIVVAGGTTQAVFKSDEFLCPTGQEIKVYLQSPNVDSAVDVDAALYDLDWTYQTEKVAFLVESQRGAHTWQGNAFYVDPVNGQSHAFGHRGGRDDPYASLQDCHDNAVTDSNHDVIFLVSGAAAGPTTLDEQVTISKRYLFIRGPGRDFIWTYSSPGDTITITADGVELSGFQLGTAATGVGDGIYVNSADFFKAKRLWINDTQGNGIRLFECNNYVIDECHLQNTGVSGAGHGIFVNAGTGTASFGVIANCHIHDVQGKGIIFDTTGGGDIHGASVLNSVIVHCDNDGIELTDASCLDITIANNVLGENGGEDIDDNGTGTVLQNNTQWSESTETTQLQSDLTTLRDVVEVANGGPPASGNTYYVDPVNGDTHANGARGGRSDPYDSVQDCHDNAITSDNNDIILLVKSYSEGLSELSDAVVLTKSQFSIRGPGGDFLWKRGTDGDVIVITGNGIKLSGFKLKTDFESGSGNGISANGADDIVIQNLIIGTTGGNSILLTSCDRFVVKGCEIFNSGIYGGSYAGVRVVGDSAYGIIEDCLIRDHQYGVWLDNGLSLYIVAPVIRRNAVLNYTQSGIRIDATYNTMPRVIGNIIPGDTPVDDSGNGTILQNNTQWATFTQVATGPSAGSIEWTVRVLNSQGVPMGDARAWVSTDQAGDNIVAGYKVTDDFGDVTFYLNAGTYYLWRDHQDFKITDNPVEMVVS